MSKPRPAVPIFTSASGRYLAWDKVLAAAKRLPGVWIPAFWNCPVTRADAVRRKRGHSLREQVGGELEAEVRNRYTDDDGADKCDLFVRWIPFDTTPTSG